MSMTLLAKYENRMTFYLVVSQLVPYKRVDIAVAACNATRQKAYRHRRGLGAKAVGSDGWANSYLSWSPAALGA